MKAETFDDILAEEDKFLEMEQLQKELSEENQEVLDWASWCQLLIG